MVLFEGKCFKFFYGVFKVGLNTQQNSPATHFSAIQNSITKLNLNSTEIAGNRIVLARPDSKLVPGVRAMDLSAPEFMLRPAVTLGTCKLPCLGCYLRVSVSSFSMVFLR